MSREACKRSPSLPEYEVSSWGRIRCVPHTTTMPYGGTRTYGGKAWRGKWHPMNKGTDNGRYKFVFKGKNYNVARLVCEAFNGPPPFKGAYCLHRDESGRNNKPGNLFWGTQKQNLNMPKFIRYCRSRTGKNSPTAKARLKKVA